MSITYFVSENTNENNSVICVKHNEGQFGENERDSASNTLFRRHQLTRVVDWKLERQQYWRCLTVYADWSLSSKGSRILWPQPLRTSLPFTDRCLLASTHNLVPVMLKISGCHFFLSRKSEGKRVYLKLFSFITKKKMHTTDDRISTKVKQNTHKGELNEANWTLRYLFHDEA